MSWLPWELESRIINLEEAVQGLAIQLSSLATQVKVLLNTTGAEEMSRLHDRLSTLVGDLNRSADTVIANATESETQFQDVITTLEAVIEKLKQKIADDASAGGSTGGGSGAR
jgi:uncharacterized coiled-coil protein SlyX